MAERPLTAKQELFVQWYVTGKLSASEAYWAAYGPTKAKAATVHRMAHRTLKLPKICARVAELRAQAAEEAKVTLEGHLQDLLFLRDKAAAASDFGPAVRAEIARAQAAGAIKTNAGTL